VNGDVNFYKEANEALNTYWELIYAHMNAAVPEGAKFIDTYYKDLVLPEQLKEEKRYVYYTIEKKTAAEIIGMCKTY